MTIVSGIRIADKDKKVHYDYPEWVNGAGLLLFNYENEEKALLRILKYISKNDCPSSYLEKELRFAPIFQDMPKELINSICFSYECGYYNTLKDYQENQTESNMVDSPAHYQIAGIEVIDLIRAATADLTGTEAYELGNAIKYLLRYQKKGKPGEDLKKCRKHIDWLIERYENE